MLVRINGVLIECPGSAGKPLKEELVAEAQRREIQSGKKFNLSRFNKKSLSQLTKPQLCQLLREVKGVAEVKSPRKSPEKPVQKEVKFSAKDPLASLPPGTLDKLNNKLSKPFQLFFTSEHGWVFLDENLNEIRRIKASALTTRIRKISMISDHKFLGVGWGGINIWDLNGNVVRQVLLLYDNWADRGGEFRQVIWAVPMDENTVLYARIRNPQRPQEGEDLYQYSLDSDETKELMSQVGDRLIITNGLFKLTGRKYIRFYTDKVAIGDISLPGIEELTDLKVPMERNGEHQVIQVSPTRFLVYGTRFQVVDVSGNTLKVKLLKKTFTLKIIEEKTILMNCAAMYDPNTVVMMSNFMSYKPTLYFLNLDTEASDTIILEAKVEERAGREFMCRLACAEGKVFGNLQENNNSLPALFELDPRTVPGFGKGGPVLKAKVKWRSFSWTMKMTIRSPSGELDIFDREEPVYVFDTLEVVQSSSPEYVAAVNMVVKLADVPKVLQEIIGKFLL